MFPVVISIVVVWVYGVIMTEAGAWNGASADTQKYCRTDQSEVLHNSPWFRWCAAPWQAPILPCSMVSCMVADPCPPAGCGDTMT